MTLVDDVDLEALTVDLPRRQETGRDPKPGETLTYVSRPRSITAAARRIDAGSKDDLSHVPKKSEKWQEEGWLYFDAVPEIKFAGRFNGNALSRLRLVVSADVDPNGPPVPIGDAIGEMGITQTMADDALDEASRMGDDDQVSAHMHEFGVNLTIPGDSWMIVTPADSVDGETWTVYSESAVTKTDRGLAIREKPGARPELLPPGTIAGRIWRRHSRWPGWADSNLRSILSEIEELLIYSRQFRAIGKSRNNAGLLFLSNKLDLPPQIGPNGETQLTSFEVELTKSMVTPTWNDASASAVVPHIVRGDGKPDELIKHFPLDRKIDDSAIARVTFLITRCAHGLDQPVEVLTGVADVNHWNAWQIADESYRMHLQPLAMVPATGLAKTFLRPGLIARGHPAEPVAKIGYEIDPSNLVVRPNRGSDAKDAFDRMAISFDALRRSLSFSEDDAPEDDEIAFRALIGLGNVHKGLGTGNEDPNTVPVTGGKDATSGGDGAARFRAIAQQMGLVPRERIAITAASRPSRKTIDLGARLAAIESRLRERLASRSSSVLDAALRTAGNRLKNKAQGNAEMRVLSKGVPADQLAPKLGPLRVAALTNTDVSGLLDGSFDEVAWDFDRWTRQSQEQAVALLKKYAPDDESAQAAIEAYTARQDADRSSARDALALALLAFGTSRLFTPAGTPDLGEVSDRLTVPTSIVREALSRAGGSTGPAREPAGVPSELDNGISGGLFAGPDMASALGEIGVEIDRWEWQVGEPDRPFEPHQDLAGVEFEGFDDDQLVNDLSWPEFDFFFPGDHDGCQCWAVAITSQAESE